MTSTVAVLGTGILGAPIARNLARAGFEVRAWNRTRAKAEPLAADGVRVVADPREAATGADVLVTVLFDADAVQAAVADALPALPDDAVWAQLSTVGVEGSDRLQALAAQHGVAYVDAPVLGTRGPAEQGKLTVLAGGEPAVRERCAPVFDAIATRTVGLDRPGDGSRLKLVMNSWVLTLTELTAEALTLAGGLGLDPALFLSTLDGGPLDHPYAQTKGRAMLAGDYEPAQFGLDGAAKDAGLIVAAASAAGLDLGVLEAVERHLTRAAQSVPGRPDMAATYEPHRRH